MIREERDPTFWQRIAEHPEVAPHVFQNGEPTDLTERVERPDILPLASEHGGYWFYGPEYELHAMFTPEGQGREANATLKAAYHYLFDRGAPALTCSEVEGWPNSRPPLSHGWRAEGGFQPGALGLSIRRWRLTDSAWRGSPAFARKR